MPLAAAARQLRYRRRKNAGLAVLRVAIPAELKADLEAAGLVGSQSDDVDPELEDVIVGVLTAFCVTRNDGA